jgi:hypothetical protein
LDDAALTILPADLVQGARLRLDAQKWYCSKLHPRFADKVAVKADVRASVVGALQLDVLLHEQILTPERLGRLEEYELIAWQTAIGTLEKLMAPGQKTIEDESTPVGEQSHVQVKR